MKPNCWTTRALEGLRLAWMDYFLAKDYIDLDKRIARILRMGLLLSYITSRIQRRKEAA